MLEKKRKTGYTTEKGGHPMEHPTKPGCLIMAAGNASRFRANKLAAQFDGKPLIRRALEAVPTELFARVVVVTQYPQVEELAAEFGFEAIRNPHPDYGISYTIRLGTAAKYAADHGYDAFTSSLLISPYQNHELLKAVGETMGKKYGVEFYYRDFRPGFREGQAKAREMGLYMQKYCGCIFSEEDRYSTKIEKAKKRYAEE